MVHALDKMGKIRKKPCSEGAEFMSDQNKQLEEDEVKDWGLRLSMEKTEFDEAAQEAEWEERRKIAVQEALEEVEKELRKEVASRMISKGYGDETVNDVTDLTLQELQNLQVEQTIKKTLTRVVLSMIADGDNNEKIVRITSLTLEEVESLRMKSEVND